MLETPETKGIPPIEVAPDVLTEAELATLKTIAEKRWTGQGICRIQVTSTHIIDGKKCARVVLSAEDGTYTASYPELSPAPVCLWTDPNALRSDFHTAVETAMES